MSLRAKILWGYGAILVLLAVMSVWAVADLGVLGRATDAILSENYRSILAAENMIDHLERQDSASLLALLGSLRDGQNQFREHQGEFLRWLARAQDNVTIPGEDAIVAALAARHHEYVSAFDVVVQERPAPEQAIEVYRRVLLPPFEQVREACVRLRELNQETMVAASERARATSRRAIVSLSLAGALTAATGLVLSILLATLLTSPLRELERATARLAQGDYDVEVSVASSDELGALARQFTLMSRKLKGYHDLNLGQVLTEKRRLDATLQSIADGIVVVDDRMLVSAINPAASATFDVLEETARGMPVTQVVDDETVCHAMKAAVRGEPAFSGDDLVLNVRRGESDRHYRCMITPVRLESGMTVGAVLVMQDFTRLLEFDRLKNEFVMAASHELRTPLTGMAMSLGVLTERLADRVDDEEQELLRAAGDEVSRLRVLVEELLDLSRIRSGRLELERAGADVARLVETALVSLRPQIAERGIGLEVDVAPDLPAVVTDANKLVWVLTNLLSNAMRYTPSGGRISVAARQVGGEIHFAVRDTGKGIAPEHQSRIFDAFVRLEHGASAGGLGLGLALSRAIVRAQGGTLWVESTPGRGSTFTFTAPVEGAGLETERSDSNGW